MRLKWAVAWRYTVEKATRDREKGLRRTRRGPRARH
jgi:hypothetical protein